ncbi:MULTISPECIES: hypothetical protein [Massilia]|uniref:hypothetical protein n=1 Tax=Massilia TaxID=149698 RepID=UPI002796579D|nr:MULTISPECIES: hypothetical protein [unclassified Massilia]MDQ1835437.1 hypothetical protein [Massilia sp. CCM 9029]MDQ1924639.1 hypothetical protein [Massilia sp. CCM 9206]
MISQYEPETESGNAIPLVVRRYAEEIATRWWRRHSAYIENPRTRLEEVIDFDESIDAFLDGLEQSGLSGRKFVEQTVLGDAPDVSADIFVALALAARSGEESILDRALEHTQALPGMPHALEGLFSWSREPLVSATLLSCLGHSDPRIQDAAFSQCHTHGKSGASHLANLVNGPATPLLARALRTAGECGRVDLLPAIRDWASQDQDTNGAVRYWASWSTVLLGGANPSSIATLRSVAESGATNNGTALQLLCVALPQDELIDYLQSISSSIKPSLLVQATGWSGHCGYAPYLIEKMRIPALASYAGEAFRLITGLDFEMAQAVIDPPPFFDDGELTLTQQMYPYPDADQAANWWAACQDDFSKEHRLLLGEKINAQRLDDILLGGEQAQRELALIHRTLSRPGDMLVPLHAHSSIQWLRLQQLKGKTI